MSGYTVESSGATLTIRGVLRLESVDSYDAVFEGLARAIAERTPDVTLELREVTLINSSGIRALANLVLVAKRHAHPMVILADRDVSWQRRTLASLAQLYDELEIRS